MSDIEEAAIRHAQADMALDPHMWVDTPAAPEPEAPHGPPLGAGHLAAMGRLGLDELAQLLPAFPDGIRPVDEPGLFGSVTPAIATEQMGYGRDGLPMEMPEAAKIEPPDVPQVEIVD